MEGFVAVTRCAVGVLCCLGAERLFSTRGEVFFPMRVARVRTVRPGAVCPLSRRGGFPTSDERIHRREVFGRQRRVCPRGKRPSSYRASRCGFPVPRPPVRRDPSSSRGVARHGSIGAGRGRRAVRGRRTVARGGPFSHRFAWSRIACVGRTTAVRRRLQSWAAGSLRLRMSSVSVGNGLCRRERTESARRKVPGGKRFVRRAGLLREHPDFGRTFLFAVGFGLSVSRKSADFRSVSFRQGCGRNAARSMPAPKSAKSYRTGSSGSNVRSASVTSSTAFQSFCRRTSRPSSREVSPVWTSSGR